MVQPTKKKWFFMWLKKAMAALEEQQISANAFAVLVVLSQRADYDTGDNAQPGNARLARLTGLSEGTVSDALAAGQAAGLIRQVRRGFSNGGAGRNSVYVMDWSAPKAAPTPAPTPAPSENRVLPSTDRADAENTENTENTETPGASSSDHLQKRRKVKKPSGRATASEPADEPIDWARVKVTEEDANARGLTRVDFNNYLVLDEERRATPSMWL